MRIHRERPDPLAPVQERDQQRQARHRLLGDLLDDIFDDSALSIDHPVDLPGYRR